MLKKVVICMMVLILIFPTFTSYSTVKAEEFKPTNNKDLMTQTGITVGYTPKAYTFGLADSYTITKRNVTWMKVWLGFMSLPFWVKGASEVNYVATTAFNAANGDGLLGAGLNKDFIEYLKDFAIDEFAGKGGFIHKDTKEYVTEVEYKAFTKAIDEIVEIYRTNGFQNLFTIGQTIDYYIARNLELSDYYDRITETSSYYDETLSDYAFEVLQHAVNQKANSSMLIFNGETKLKDLEGVVTPTLSKGNMQQLVREIYDVLVNKTMTDDSYAAALVYDYLESAGYYSILKYGKIEQFELSEAAALEKAKALKEESSDQADIKVVKMPSQEIIWSTEDVDLSGYWKLEDTSGQTLALLNFTHSDKDNLDSKIEGIWYEKIGKVILQYPITGSYRDALTDYLNLTLAIEGKDVIKKRYGVEPSNSAFWEKEKLFVTERLEFTRNTKDKELFEGEYKKAFVTTTDGYNHHEVGPGNDGTLENRRTSVVLKRFTGKDPMEAFEEEEVEEEKAALNWESKKEVDPYHNWTIRFSQNINKNSVNQDNIFVLHNGTKLEGIEVKLNADGRSITVKAPEGGYQIEETYNLMISHAIQSQSGNSLKQPVVMQFTIKERETDTVIFNDTTLEKLVRKKLGLGENEPITKGKMKELEYLSYKYTDSREQKISSLVGLEYATNLQGINFESSNVSDLTPIKGLTKLQTITFFSSALKSLEPLAESSMPQLRKITIVHGEVVDVSPLVRGDFPSLEDIDISFNKVQDLSPLFASKEKYENYTTVDLSGNNISDIGSLSNVKLPYSLDLEANNIKDISNVKNLEGRYLDLGRNQLENLEGIENIRITYDGELDLSYNNISDLSPFYDMKIEDRRSSGALDLSHNNITDISPLVNGDFNSIDLFDNKISDISMIHKFKTSTLYLQKNNISSLNFKGDVEMSKLNLANNKLTNIAGIEKLHVQEIDFSTNNIADLTGIENAPSEISVLYLSSNAISDIRLLENIESMKKINLIKNPLDENAKDIIETLKKKGISISY